MWQWGLAVAWSGAETVTETLDTLFADDGEERTLRIGPRMFGSLRIGLICWGEELPRSCGESPYITVKDKQENENYRKAYDACAGSMRCRFRLHRGF